MNAIELEDAFWRDQTAAFASPSGDFLAEGFAPPGGLVADFGIVRDGDEFHLFYIERRVGGCCAWPGHEIYFGHSSTRDFQTWRCHEPVMLIRPGTWEGAHVYAPYVFAHEGRYYMAYTGLNERHSQRIGMAVSDDLFHWERFTQNPVITPGDWAYWTESGPCSCRDPHVCLVDGVFHLYYTAVTRDGDGCVALAVSSDLVSWEDRGPVHSIRRASAGGLGGSNHLESACMHTLGDRHLLFYNHMGGVRFVASPSSTSFGDVEGTMLWPAVNGFELVATSGCKWLVGAFCGEGRFRLGILDWEVQANVLPVSAKEQLTCFLG